MKNKLIVAFVFVIAFAVAPARAVDYTVDLTFQVSLPALADVQDLAIQPDGKVVIVGPFEQISGASRRYIGRLNADGSLDSTFTSPLSAPQSGPDGVVEKIKLLPDGKFLIVGRFQVGAQLTRYARLNSDGTVDPSITLGTLGENIFPWEIEPLPDGKFLVCGGGTQAATRLNVDGTVDASFQTDLGGVCYRLSRRTDGKIFIVGQLLFGGNLAGPVLVMNSDGSRDVTFDTVLPNDSYANVDVVETPGGKLWVNYIWQNQDRVKRLMPDGSLDLDFPNCTARSFLPRSDGSTLLTHCRKPGSISNQPWSLARILPDGTFDQGFDWLGIQGINYLAIHATPGDAVYVTGRISLATPDGARAHVVRLIPDTVPRKARFDFDGDGRSDLSVFRPSDRYWYINRSAAGPAYVQWGLTTDKLAAGHYDGDGKTDIGVFRDGIWYELSSVSGYIFTVLGAAGDKPFFADFGGIGTESRMLRGLRGGTPTWIFPSSNNRVLSGEQLSDIPVIGDFEGDGRDEIGYFRDGVWYGGISDWTLPWQARMQWGIAGDIPVPGDYDGDRQTDYAVFRPSTGAWWINRTTAGMIAIQFGLDGDIPVPADYDGDGKIDIAIFRNGKWWQICSSDGAVQVDNWGIAGDIPIPAQNQ